MSISELKQKLQKLQNEFGYINTDKMVDLIKRQQEIKLSLEREGIK